MDPSREKKHFKGESLRNSIKLPTMLYEINYLYILMVKSKRSLSLNLFELFLKFLIN